MSWKTNDEIYKKTLPVRPKTAMGRLKRKKKKKKQDKLLQRVLCYTQTQRETVTKLPKIYSSKTIHSLSVSEVIESMDNYKSRQQSNHESYIKRSKYAN